MLSDIISTPLWLLIAIPVLIYPSLGEIITDRSTISPYRAPELVIVTPQPTPLPVVKPKPVSTPVSNPMREQVLAMVEDAGFNRITADRVIKCESGWNPQAVHTNSNGTKDRGLWQINSVHGLSVADSEDIVKSTEYAITLMQSKRSWEHWVCH